MAAALRIHDPEIDIWADRRMAECQRAYRRNVRETAMQTRAAQSWSYLEDLGFEHDPLASDHPAVVQYMNDQALEFRAATARIAMAIDPEDTVPADLNDPVPSLPPASMDPISTKGERALVALGFGVLVTWGSLALISRLSRYDLLGWFLP